MVKLYGSKGSGSAAIEAALTLVGQPFETVDAALWQADEAAGLEELRHVNPLAQLPTLVLDDGSVLTESAAILIQLGLSNPSSPLLPKDERQRTQTIRGLVYIAANCYAVIGYLDYPERWYADPDDTARDAMRRGGLARLHALWDTFADQFPATPWLSGADLGALDLLAATVSHWSGARSHLEASRPLFAELLARIDTEPRIAAVWQRHWARQG